MPALTADKSVRYDKDGKPYRQLSSGARHYLPSKPGEVVNPETGDIVGMADSSASDLTKSTERFYIQADPTKPSTTFPPSFAALFKVCFAATVYAGALWMRGTPMSIREYLTMLLIVSCGILVYYLIPGLNRAAKSVYLWTRSMPATV